MLCVKMVEPRNNGSLMNPALELEGIRKRYVNGTVTVPRPSEVPPKSSALNNWGSPGSQIGEGAGSIKENPGDQMTW